MGRGYEESGEYEDDLLARIYGAGGHGNEPPPSRAGIPPQQRAGHPPPPRAKGDDGPPEKKRRLPPIIPIPMPFPGKPPEEEPPPDTTLPVVWVTWIAVDDARTCQLCLDNAAASPRPLGTPFPSGDITPPVHMFCRCYLIGANGEGPIPTPPQDDSAPWGAGGKSPSAGGDV